ncbi:MAG: phosphodiester glycosidase family protein [Kofleriaceae bacterium]
MLSLLCAVACGRGRRHPPPPPAAIVDGGAAIDAAAPPPAGCDGQRHALAPGLTIERHRIAGTSALPTLTPCLELVRVDVGRYPPRLVMASRDGAPRPVTTWADAVGAVAAVNAGMFGDDHRALGQLRDRDHVDRDRDNPRYGGWLLFDPHDPADPAVRIVGRGCAGVDVAALRRRYRGEVQSYRLLGCDGEALAWADAKSYSAAAIAVDRHGRLVFAHLRAPLRMGELAAALATPAFDLVGALYAEGGPEATVVAGTGAARVTSYGSYETGFWEDDSNHTGWDVPNVLVAAPPASAPP